MTLDPKGASSIAEEITGRGGDMKLTTTMSQTKAAFILAASRGLAGLGDCHKDASNEPRNLG